MRSSFLARAGTAAPAVPRALALLGLVALTASCARLRELGIPLPGGQQYDLVVTGGLVVDGTGAAPYRADVGVVDGRIVRVGGSLDRAHATRVIDAAGKVVAPGFIDAHAHLDGLLRDPDAASLARQGVTTALGGLDGTSPLPLFIYLDSLRDAGVAVNVAFLAGHAALRRRVLGDSTGLADLDQIDAMRRLLAEAMGDGAWGLSTALDRAPGAGASTTELVALAEVASDSGGVYATRPADDGAGLISGVARALEVGRRALVPVILTAHRAVGPPMWGASRRTLAMADSARAAGREVWFDQDPYDALTGDIDELVPAWAMDGGVDAFLARTRRPEFRDRIVDGIIRHIVDRRGGGDLARIRLLRVPWAPQLEGKTLREWAEMRYLDPVPEAGAELVIETIRRGGARVEYRALDDGDVRRILADQHTMIASDGGPADAEDSGGPLPHPRAFSAFPHALVTWVRQDSLLTLEEAVRRMTSLPARVIGLVERGRLAEGYAADIVVLDTDGLRDLATYQDPRRYPQGVDWVVVNGTPVVADGAWVGSRPGQVLRRPHGWNLMDRRVLGR